MLGTPHPWPCVRGWEENHAARENSSLWTELTLEERRERRQLRRVKQREDNVKRAAKMHAARLKSEANSAKLTPQHKQSIFVGCSGWRYWKWRGLIL